MTSTAEAGPTTIRSTFVPIVALALVAVVAPVAVAHHYGALDIPRSDDWSYLHTLFLWHRTGHWDFNDWVSMTLVGQVLASAPIVAVFGESITAISIAWAIVGFAGLLAVVGIARILGLTSRQGCLVALAVAACPLWGALAPTFMTDVPAFAFEMFALALGGLALKRDSARLLVGAVAAGFVAIAIRQYAAIPVGALLLSTVWIAVLRRDKSRVRVVLGLVVGLGVAVIALLVWWSHVPNGKVLGPRVPNVESVRLTIANTANFWRLSGIVLLPITVLTRPRQVLRRAFECDRVLARRMLVAATALLVLGYLLATSRPFIGNYFDGRGVLSNDIIAGTRPRIMPAIAFDTLVLLGTLSALVLVLAAVPCASDLLRAVRARSLGRPDPFVMTVGLTVAGLTVVYALATFLRMGFSERTAVFDRYALPMLPLIGLLFLRSTRTGTRPDDHATRPPPRRAASIVALAALALVGLSYTAESASFDASRWKLAEKVVALGYSPLQIHAGYEWEGWFRGNGPLTADTVAERQSLRAAYFQGMCVTIFIAPKTTPPNPIATSKSTAPTRRAAPLVAARNARSCSLPPGLGSSGEKPIHTR